ncbi:hypothetical protein MJT46_002578 [Ovis ammon polii x Ovis aries]|nr:hypothetical protein MJT46_002578 [Ovis ammon polii x Ovis aries]
MAETLHSQCKQPRVKPWPEFLVDDLTDDIMDVKKVLDKVGINSWLAYDILCSEKLDQWLCEKLEILAAFAASALFLFLEFLFPVATLFCFFVPP